MTSVSRLRYECAPIAFLVAMAVGTTQGCTDSDADEATGGTGGNLGGSAGGPAAGGSDAAGTDNGGNAGAAPEATAGAAGSSAGGAPPTGFVTWTYDDTPMGLYVPPDASDSLPIVTYLHACNNDPVYPGNWIIAAANDVESCAVFIPTAPPATTPPYSDYPCADWGGTYDPSLRPNMLNALTELDRLIEDYGFDAGRQYLYGDSMGGEGVFRLLADFPTRFAAAVSVAGYTLDTGASEMAETPLWLFHGADDTISSVESSRTIYQSILDAGGTQVQYTEYPGLDHVPAIEQARTEPGLFEWLFEQHR